jgi:tetratricopeptide (TPR) repeat protein
MDFNDYYKRGRAYSQEGKYDLAIVDLEAALNLDPYHPDSGLIRGAIEAFKETVQAKDQLGRSLDNLINYIQEKQSENRGIHRVDSNDAAAYLERGHD